MTDHVEPVPFDLWELLAVLRVVDDHLKWTEDDVLETAKVKILASFAQWDELRRAAAS